MFRSSKHIYAQVIDDAAGRTLASASSLEKDLKSSLKTGADKDAAALVGKLVAERAVSAGVKEVVFDRGAYIFHGRVKALADPSKWRNGVISRKDVADFIVKAIGDNTTIRRDPVLVYSDTKGLYAGASIQTGGVVADKKANLKYYGMSMPQVHLSGKARMTPTGQALVNRILKYSR